MKVRTKKEFRQRRHMRLRQRIQGTAERPRMSVFVSNRHMYVQFIDDLAQKTIIATTTQSAGVEAGGRNTVEVAKRLGQAAAQSAKEKGIQAVVFDRGGFAYRGRVKAIAEAAREGGLQF